MNEIGAIKTVRGRRNQRQKYVQPYQLPKFCLVRRTLGRTTMYAYFPVKIDLVIITLGKNLMFTPIILQWGVWADHL